jgi:drug/metabolite transporter (DMT)-like permease
VARWWSLNTGWLLLIIPGLIWGASFLFIAEGLRAVNPNGVTFLRICVGFATLALFPAARKKIERSDWGKVALLGVLWFAFPLSMFPFAEQRVSSALTGMLNGANPLFATLVACFLVRRAPSRGVTVGLAIGLAGTVIMAIPAMDQGHSSSLGIGMILIALVSYGFALSLARSLQMKYGAIPVIWRAQLIGLLLTAPLGIPDLLRAHWSPVPLFSLLALGAGGTAIANVLLASAAGQFGAAKASGTTFLIPFVALALGVFVRHEQVALLSVVGSLVCVSGAWFMKRASSH